jgi:hypothetical protein
MADGRTVAMSVNPVEPRPLYKPYSKYKDSGPRPRARPRPPRPADGQHQDDECERRSPAAPATV